MPATPVCFSVVWTSASLKPPWCPLVPWLRGPGYLHTTLTEWVLLQKCPLPGNLFSFQNHKQRAHFHISLCHSRSQPGPALVPPFISWAGAGPRSGFFPLSLALPLTSKLRGSWRQGEGEREMKRGLSSLGSLLGDLEEGYLRLLAFLLKRRQNPFFSN